jgi:hypothetical protein
MRDQIGIPAVLALALSAIGQVAPPKSKDVANLSKRYESIKCALVLIKAGPHTGTGFYIDSAGDIVTASHVVGDRRFSVNQSGAVEVRLFGSPDITIQGNGEPFTVKRDDVLESNGDSWLADLVVLRSSKPAKCWLETGDSSEVTPGQHILSIGFPGLAFGSLSMYTGIVSARLRPDMPMGKTDLGALLAYTNDFFRVQIPASPGLSGAPVIDDRNRAIGVVTNAGMWSDQLELLSQFEASRELAPQPPAAANQTSVDWIAATGQLARFFHDWASPGYGDAVPLSYLKRGSPKPDQQPDKSAH